MSYYYSFVIRNYPSREGKAQQQNIQGSLFNNLKQDNSKEMRWHLSDTLNSTVTQTWFLTMATERLWMSYGRQQPMQSSCAEPFHCLVHLGKGKGREATNARTQLTSLFVYRGNGECACVLTRIVPVLSDL